MPPSERRARSAARQEAVEAAAHLRAWGALGAHCSGRTVPPQAVYSLALCSTPTGGRRFRPRTPGLVLTEAERERCRQQIDVATACGSSFAAFRRYTPTDRGMVEERLICQQKCGTRTCEECEGEIRKRECWRVEGPWRQFYTLGCPPAGRSHQECWRVIRRARDLLFKRIERELERGNEKVVRVDRVDAETAAAHRATVPRRRVRQSPLDYAWTLEPHETGFPHLHFVTNTSYIKWAWIKKTWGRLVGAEIQWMRCEWVYDSSGTCRYLSKYISKTVFAPDLLALMYRQRMWATSRPLKVVKIREWLRERDTSEREAARLASDPATAWGEAGWSIEQHAPGRYTKMSRFWPLHSEWDAWLFADVTGNRWDANRQNAARARKKPGELLDISEIIKGFPEICVKDIAA